jgi:hypothetical protein
LFVASFDILAKPKANRQLVLYTCSKNLSAAIEGGNPSRVTLIENATKLSLIIEITLSSERAEALICSNNKSAPSLIDLMTEKRNEE